jgi:hypothetical protein
MGIVKVVPFSYSAVLPIILILALGTSFSVRSVDAEGLPTTEQFSSMLTNCAAGSNIDVKADLIGSIATIYNGQRTQGAASFQSSTEFLKLIPENSRLEAYRLYTQCIKDIISKH